MLEDAKFNVDILTIQTGDDMQALVELGHDSMYRRTRLRLFGVAAPEIGSEQYNSTIREIHKLIGEKGIIKVHYVRGSSWIVTLWNSDMQSVNNKLIDMGYVYERESSEGQTA